MEVDAEPLLAGKRMARSASSLKWAKTLWTSQRIQMTGTDIGAGLRAFTLAEALRIAKNRRSLATGSSGIDSLLGGGYPEGEMVEVFGESNTGKTQLAMQATVMAARGGWTSVYIDTESKFRPERVAKMAEANGLDGKTVLERVFCVEARNVREQMNAISKIEENSRVSAARLLVIDSLTKNFSLEFPGKQATGKRQAMLTVHLSGIARDAFLNNRAVLLTNRVASVPEEGMTRVVSLGGFTVRRFLRNSIRLERSGRSVLARLDEEGRAGKVVTCSITEEGFR